VPQFINHETALAPHFALLIITFISLAALNALAYALLAEKLRKRIRRPNVLKYINRAGDGALLVMGGLSASLQRS
jgi:threonine/homoserine/homoserine lactone efflux protein